LLERPRRAVEMPQRAAMAASAPAGAEVVGPTPLTDRVAVTAAPVCV
jgi:hypothetical protein